MSRPKVVTITNPVQLLLARLNEIRTGNARTRDEIEHQRRLLRGGETEEARLGARLKKLLEGKRLDGSQKPE